MIESGHWWAQRVHADRRGVLVIPCSEGGSELLPLGVLFFVVARKGLCQLRRGETTLPAAWRESSWVQLLTSLLGCGCCACIDVELLRAGVIHVVLMSSMYVYYDVCQVDLNALRASEYEQGLWRPQSEEWLDDADLSKKGNDSEDGDGGRCGVAMATKEVQAGNVRE